MVDIESGEECGPGEKGELYIRGPCVFKGYYKNPTATEGNFLKAVIKRLFHI